MSSSNSRSASRGQGCRLQGIDMKKSVTSEDDVGGSSTQRHLVDVKDDEDDAHILPAKVCYICGDAGFLECLAICGRCNEGAEHAYCMATIPDTVPSDWLCEECQQESCIEARNKWLAGDGLQQIQPYKKRLLSKVPSFDFLPSKVSCSTQLEKLLAYEGALENGAELGSSVRTEVGDGILKESSCSGRANVVASMSSAHMGTRDDGSPSISQNVFTEKLKKIIYQITNDMKIATPRLGLVVSTTVEKEGGMEDFGTRLQVEEEVHGSGGALASPLSVVKNMHGDSGSDSPPPSGTAPPHSEVANGRMSEGRVPYQSALTNECVPVQGSASSSASLTIATRNRITKSRPAVVKSKQVDTARRLSCGERIADNKAQYHIAKEDGDATASSRCLSQERCKSITSIVRASKVAYAMRTLLKRQGLSKLQEKAGIMSRAKPRNDVEVSYRAIKGPHNTSLTMPDTEFTQADMPSACVPGIDELVNISGPYPNAGEMSAKNSPAVSHVTVTETPFSKNRSSRDRVACTQKDEVPHLPLEQPGGAQATQKACRKNASCEGQGISEAERALSSERVDAAVLSSLPCREPARRAASSEKLATIGGLNDGASTTSHMCTPYSSRETEDGSSGSSFNMSLSLRPDDSHPSKLAMKRSNKMRRGAVGPGEANKNTVGIAKFKAGEEPHDGHIGVGDGVVRYGSLDRASRASRAMKHDSNSGPFNKSVRCYLCNEVGHPAKLCQNANVGRRPQREWRRPPPPPFDPRFGNQQVDTSHAKMPFSHPPDQFWDRPLQRPFVGVGDHIVEREPWRAPPRRGKEARFKKRSRQREGFDAINYGTMPFSNTLEPRPEFGVQELGEHCVGNIRCDPSRSSEYVRGLGTQAVRLQDKVANVGILRGPGHPPPLPPPGIGKAFPSHGYTTSQKAGPDERQRAGFQSGPLSNQAFREGGYPPMLLVRPNISSQSQAPTHPNTDSVQERRAAPDLQVLWTGCFSIASKTTRPTCYTELQASLSTKANPKVFEALLAMPPELRLEEMRRGMENDTWPRSFRESPPTSDSIGMYFFPKNFKRDDAWYKSLVQGLFTNNLVLRAAMEFAQLLIFPSQLLPEGQQRWFGRFFLWGIFRRKVIGPGHEAPGRPLLRDPGHELASSRGNGEVIDMDIDPDDAPPQTRGTFSSFS